MILFFRMEFKFLAKRSFLILYDSTHRCLVVPKHRTTTTQTFLQSIPVLVNNHKHVLTETSGTISTAMKINIVKLGVAFYQIK